MLSGLLVSIIVSFGIAVLLVEKRHEWPVRTINIRLRYFIHRRMSRRLKHILRCTICCSFWTPLLTDLYLFSFGGHFLWPLTGFATAGLTWLIYEILNLIDKIAETEDDYD